MSVIRNHCSRGGRDGVQSGGKQSGEGRLGQTTDSVKGQIGDLDIQQEDFIKGVMVLVLHDQAGRGRDWRYENDEATDIATQD